MASLESICVTHHSQLAAASVVCTTNITTIYGYGDATSEAMFVHVGVCEVMPN